MVATIPGVDEAVLQVQEVTFGYGSRPLFYHVSLQVRRGEMIGLLGPNGSGKTTLLRLMSGFLQPQQGHIVLEGRDLSRWGRKKVAQRIAVVPQALHVPFAFTVEHMVSLGRTPFVTAFFGSPTHQDQVIVQDAIEAAGIGPLANRIFNELSGGEQQRVVIAMALAQQPLLLLLDEPTSHLDIKYQIETLELIQKLNRERRVTVIAAIHDLNLAARYFPRLLLFQHGVVADARPAEVLEPGLLRRVYGVNVQVGILRGTTHLSVLPPASEMVEGAVEKSSQPHVHVMAGGGSGEVLMRALADAHIPFVAGALNIGDSDHTLALRLADDVITEPPYAPISPQALEQVRDSLEQAILLVLCPTPIGPGNLVLLREAVQAIQRGLPVLLLATPVISSSTRLPDGADADITGDEQHAELAARDYTGGEGLKLLEMLLQSGAVVVQSVGEVLEMLGNQRFLIPSAKNSPSD
jgi:iron complex transport system ATP-binding protein